ncbi:MAG: hypothetical protein ABUL55_02490 [Pseudomonadota bacterium]
MWHEGFGLDLVAWLLNALALAFGVFLGARALIDPHWAARLVRLKADEARPGGFAEFRATFGGVFLGLHVFALLLSFYWIANGIAVVGVCAIGASGAIAAGWFGAAFGRAVSIWRDAGARTQFNLISVGVEAATGLLIAAPWVVWLFQKPD